MDALKRKRGVEKGNITKAVTWINSIDKDLVTVIFLKNKRELVQGYFVKFEEIQSQIEDLCADEAELMTQLPEREEFENRFLDVVSKIDDIIDEKTPDPQQAAHSSHTSSFSRVKLPQLDLPIFHGKYEDWDLSRFFVASIDTNTSLSKAQKLQYLKSALKGDAATLVKTLTICDANYDEAWQILTERVSSYIDRAKRPVEHWDDVCAFYFGENGPGDTQAWAIKLIGTDMPKLSELFTFMEQHIRGPEASAVSGQIPQNVNTFNPKRKLNTHFSSVNTKCPLCKSEQFIQVPDLFVQTTERKHEIVKSLISASTVFAVTTGSMTAEASQMQDITFNPNDGAPPSNQTSGTSSTATPTFSVYGGGLRTNVLLATAIASVKYNEGNLHHVRVLLDTGSEASFISEKCVLGLGLQRRRSEVVVTGISSSSGGTTKGEVDLNLFSCITTHSIQISCLILPKLTSSIPSELCANSRWPHVQGLQLADPDFNVPGNIDILLGAEYVPLLMCEGRKFGPPNTPVAENTIFGWVLLGRVASKGQESVRNHHVHCAVDELLIKFWETEELPQSRQLTPLEQQAEDHFRSTHSRDDDGRYVVNYPSTANIDKLGSSREAASSLSMEASGEKLIPENQSHEVIGKTYYLPHHFVYKTGMTENKFRVVFDGSFKSSSNISLNDCLLVGPTIQSDLFTILLRFRTHQIVIKADIGKMFRQFWIHPDHQDYQRIVWRATPQEPLRDYRLKTITYGTAAASYQSTRCVEELARENKEKYPIASKALSEDSYVDDLMSGTSTTTEAIKVSQDLQTIVSNTFTTSSKVTKKILLSEIAKVFDPLGFLSPVIIREKILLQELWKADLSWNDELPEHILQQWLQYNQEKKISAASSFPGASCHHLHIKNRTPWFLMPPSSYGAVIYLRTQQQKGNYHVCMIIAKTKVAPIKQSNLPRLKLLGAVLVAELLTTVKKAINIDADIFAWCDSTIVLKWIAAFPGRWQTLWEIESLKFNNSSPLTTGNALQEKRIQLIVPPVESHHLNYNNIHCGGLDLPC
ncbi:hypothetical protein Ocin01_10639 [Orchesella cincta]|uniref:Uncharacterized protein n=1 Tax=Orchesella cincta TaxID=48709 RepID=A0A1D2MSY2_ORCCI|nr:hypothetical protein Ocin01_10639 [Orchesella cincta]